VIELKKRTRGKRDKSDERDKRGRRGQRGKHIHEGRMVRAIKGQEADFKHEIEQSRGGGQG
jgi:hypothetical protein